jgi:hypothetical protein
MPPARIASEETCCSTPATFTRAYTRARLAIKHIRSYRVHCLLTQPIEQLTRALQALAERHTRLDGKKLCKRAEREIEKLVWCFPERDETALVSALMQSGFSHKIAIIKILRGCLTSRVDSLSLSEDALSRLIAKNFRKALREAGGRSLGLEKATLNATKAELQRLSKQE